MQDRPKKPKNNRLSLGVIAGITIAALAIGGGASWLAYRTLTALKTPSEPTVTQSEPTTAPPDQSLVQEEGAQVYWLADSGGRLKLLPTKVAVQKSASEQERLETAFKELLAGPKKSSETTAIPEGTKLLDLTVEKDGVHLNLSQEFTTGGGSASMMGRLGQIVYTATSVDPNTQVWIDVEGKPLELLGEGEGLMVEQPMTRKIFETDFEL
ncbi:spore germination protein [Pleurocapsa sp. PCC 7327]|uniref:GerMN domain-containing protein n=1 Tax=Pleurocapsa sp. PCC 7327 TaxID=118163 RepID=UPI00029FC51C|nr:GerMN domain-containing protein [Pleurocapsa sp. PCC 7327]AFY79608.1 spore germination protein [Pleurocapsa sp. PCC 7327]